MELKQMTNQQVAKRMYHYIVRLEALRDIVVKAIDYKQQVDVDYVRSEYKSLKNAIKEDAHYMSLGRNQKKDNSVLQRQFSWVIQEASACGFSSSVNSKIDFQYLYIH